MTRLKKKTKECGFDETAKVNGWWRGPEFSGSFKRICYTNSQDHSYVTIYFSRYLYTITRIMWWNQPNSIFKVWEPHYDEEHISISRVNHILRGTISPHTNT